MKQTQVPSLGQEDPLEEETAPHSSILAWKIPWTEETDRLQSMGSLRVGLRGSLKNCIKIQNHLDEDKTSAMLPSSQDNSGIWPSHKEQLDTVSMGKKIIRIHITLNSLFASCGLASIYTTPPLVFAAPLWNELGIIPSFPTHLLCMALEKAHYSGILCPSGKVG